MNEVVPLLDKSTQFSRNNRDSGVRRHRAARIRRTPGAERLHPVMSVVRVPDAALRPGAVIHARVPFEECPDYKPRPAIVVAVEADAVLVLPCTTSVQARRRGWAAITNLAIAGLVRPTFVKPRLVAVPRLDVIEALGRLSEADARRILGMGSQVAA